MISVTRDSLVSGSRAKLFACEKVVSPARVTIPAEARQLASPSSLASFQWTNFAALSCGLSYFVRIAFKLP